MMTLPVSLLLVATGAILVWGITSDPDNLDLDAIGVILMVVGVLGFLLSLLFWDRLRFGPARRRTYVERPAAPRRPDAYPARTTVVDEEVEERPPPAPPP
jgi:hypothetical protein